MDRTIPRLKVKESASVEYRSLAAIPTSVLLAKLEIEQEIVEG